MKKYIPLFIAVYLFAMDIGTQAQTLSSKITSIVNPNCSYDSNGSAAITAYGGFPPYTYLWEPNGQTTDTATGLLAAMAYSVMVTDSGGVDTAFNYVTLSSVSTLAASTSSADASCYGLLNGLAAVIPTGGLAPYRYLWSPVAQTTDTLTSVGVGTYTSTVIDSLGCLASASATVGQPAQLALNAASFDSLAIAVASGGTAPYTYSWSPGGYSSDTVRGLHRGIYTVTVTDGHLCSSVAVISVTGAELYFALGDTSVTCGNPSYFNFDVLISSDSAKRLNDCEVYLNIPQSEFSGDVLFNGIYITQGPNFQYDSGANDYQMILGQHDSVIDIGLGSFGFHSPLGTIVDTTPQVLFHISLKITNSCGTGVIAFDPSNFFLSYYVYEDSVYSNIDSTKLSYTTCCPYQCGDSLCPPHLCNAYCCHMDSLGNCIDSCYDTCYTCPVYCLDTTWTYSYDSAYSYYNYKNIPYLNTSYSAPIPASSCSPYIDTYNNPIMAGTNAKSVPPNSSILTIKGMGFGSEKGFVQVTDANQGAVLQLDTSDILQWSENEITIKMPDYSYNSLDSLTPGSGPFTLYNACFEIAQSINHNTELQVNYNIENTGNSGEKLRPNIVMANDSESFKFMCDTSVWNNPQALACVKKAIHTWNCYTGVNWKLVGDTIGDTTKKDGISVIYFSNKLVNRNAFMETQSWYLTNSCYDAFDSITFKNEADINIRRIPQIGYTWSYDTTNNIVPGNHYYFYDAILHELGHAHGLNHINDTLSLMYRYILPNHRDSITSGSTYPGPATLIGALDMINTSIANSPSILGCGSHGILVPSFRYCIDPTLGVPLIPNNPYNLVLFPNPTNNSDINFAYQLTKNSYVQFKIEDAIGRVMIKLKEEQEPPGTYGEKINIDTLAAGVYLFTVNINGEIQTVKFIKL